MGFRYLESIGYRDTLNMLLVAFCRDYFSRKAVIESGKCSRRTRMEYEYINGRIADATREIVGDYFEVFIKEIGESIGYTHSRVDNLCENLYKQYKKEVKINIARKLHLID